MSQIFYSQVNSKLQAELLARGRAGSSDRGTAAIAYMVEKIANIELTAYPDKPVTDMKAMPGFGVLGGQTVLGGAYMPIGYLTDIRPAHRIPPILQSMSVSMNDQSKSFINKLTVEILVPDATTDLDEIEDIYCKPGRYVKIKVVHPLSAILTTADLADEGLPGNIQLKKFYPDVDDANLRAMNEFYFTGRISTFNYSYNSDGSVTVSFEAIGTSNTYLDIQLIMQNLKSPTHALAPPTKTVSDLYNSLNDEVTQWIDSYAKLNKLEFEHLITATNDQGILVGIPYKIAKTNAESIKMVSLGYLINFINTKILTNIKANSNDIITIECSDNICQSNYYSNIVSADPTSVLLWRGTSANNTDTYMWDAEDLGPPEVPEWKQLEAAARATGLQSAELLTKYSNLRTKLSIFPNVTPVSPGFSVDSKSFPSRIYINLESIKTIVAALNLSELYTLKDFLNEIGKLIRTATGQAINLVVIQHPQLAHVLMYYDSNFLDSVAKVNEFTIPAFPGISGGTVVRNFTLTSNVPNSVKNMIFGITLGDVGTQKQVSFAGYVYSDGQFKKDFEDKWKENYRIFRKELAFRKYEFSQKPNNPTTITALQKVLEQYVTHFDPDIKICLGKSKSIFPMDLEFTIDGINGFKYGDVLNFSGLPKRYTKSFVFTILRITHNVSTAGEWTTVIKCLPRIRIKD